MLKCTVGSKCNMQLPRQKKLNCDEAHFAVLISPVQFLDWRFFYALEIRLYSLLITGSEMQELLQHIKVNTDYSKKA